MSPTSYQTAPPRDQDCQYTPATSDVKRSLAEGSDFYNSLLSLGWRIKDHFSSGGVTNVVTITIITTAE